MKLMILVFMIVFSVKAQVKVLSYNTWLLPSIFMTAHKPNKRVEAIADYLCSSGHDIVALQEVFKKSHYKKLNKVLSNCGYIHSTGKADIQGIKLLRSGLVVFSKHPIHKENFLKFKNCHADDCFASKGFLDLEINVNGKLVNIINTHMQASNSAPRIKARQSQLKQLANYLENKLSQSPTIIMGDFNIDKYGFEFQDLLSSMKTREHIVEGDNTFTSDGFLNDHKRRKKHKERELLDYIFSYNDELPISNKIIRPKGNYAKEKQIDLSDHFAVEAFINL